MAQELEQGVRAIIAEILEMKPGDISPDAHLINDLGMDSMMALEILASIEKRFKIKVDEADLPKITSVNRAIEVAKRYVR